MTTEEERKATLKDATTGNAPSGGTKKKRNRKKKKKGSGNNEASGDEAKALEASKATEESKMNPHAVLCNRILAQGFTSQQIDKAMEDMWNQNLPYDQYEEVLKFLKNEKEEVKEEKEVPQPAAPEQVEEEQAVEPEPAAPEEEEEEEQPSNLKQPPPMTMVQKLDMVAGFENMTDAIFALTEWVNKAAKPNELEDLCMAKKTQALPTIFRRSIAECDDQARFDSAVLPAMVRLLASLLGKSGVPSSDVVETQTAFETLLKQARRVFLVQQPDAEEFAGRVSQFVVSRLSLAIGDSRGVDETAAADSTGASAVASLGDHGSSSLDQGIAELLAKRESDVTSTKRFSSMTRSTCASLMSQSGATPMTNGGAPETEMPKADIMLALVGQDTMARLESEKANLEELKARSRQGESDQLHELRKSAEETSEERQMIQARIYELRVSIEKLETYDAELCAKVNDLESEIESQVALESAQVSSLGDQIADATQAVKYGTSLFSLVDMLKKYDDSLGKAMETSNQSLPVNVNAGEVASQQMGNFLSRVNGYFQAEVVCIDQLNMRIKDSQKKMAELKTEIMECEGLGMDTTIGQMEVTVRAKEELIKNDTALIERFKREASALFDSLVSRLEEYQAAESIHGLAPIQTQSIESVPANASQLGIPNVERLSPFLSSVMLHSASPRSTDPPVAPNTGMKVAPIGTPKTEVKKGSEPAPAVLPKFTWATASKPAESASKTSLLDIQKEELESKSPE